MTMLNSSPTVTIEVTPDIALKIRQMADLGVFSLITGTLTLHFLKGELKSGKTEITTHLKGYPQVIGLTAGQEISILK